MKPYELLYIIPAVMTETEAEPIANKITDMIKATGATILRTENLGKLKLAYTIKHQKYGYYMLVQFDADPAITVKLDTDLRLNENVLRHQVTIRPEGAEKRVYKLESYQAPVNEEGVTTRPKSGDRDNKRKPTTNAPVMSAAPMKKGPEMSVEELDKKLDAILEGTGENV